MDGNKAAYWIAVAALAFGLNAQYRDGGFASLHRVAGETSVRAELMFQRLAFGAEQTVAEVRDTVRDEARAIAIGSEFEVRSRLHRKSSAGVMMASADSTEMASERREMLREQALAKAETLRAQFLAQREMVRAQAEAQYETQTDLRQAEFEKMHAQMVAQRALADGRIRMICSKLSEKRAAARIAVLNQGKSKSIEIDTDDDETF